MGDGKDWSDCEVEGIKGTSSTDGGALWCVVLATGEAFSVPEKLIRDDSEVWKPGDEGTLVIPQWLAEEKRLV